MSFFRKKSHKRLESRDAEQSDDFYEAITADYTFEGGVQGTAVGLSLSGSSMIEKVAATSPFAAKLKVGDTIIKVNGKDTLSTSFSELLEQELAQTEKIELVVLRKRAGSRVSGMSEGSAFDGKEN